MERQPDFFDTASAPRPTVSVVMCTYNGGKYLREQLDSIVRQTYPVLELLIQDDGSTDDTLYICQTYAARYGFVHVYRNESPQGVNRNFISCIRRAKGDYIAISDQDDIWALDKLSCQMARIGDALFSSCFSEPFSADAQVSVHVDGRLPNHTAERLIHVGSCPGHTQLFRRDFLDKIPDVDHWLQYFMYDHLFQIVAACYGSISFCDRTRVYNRRHVSAVTYSKPLDYTKSLRNMLAVVKRTYALYRELRPAMRYHFGWVYALLSALPAEADHKADAQKIAYYQTKKSFWAYLRLTALYVKCRHKISYSDDASGCSTLLRALYFPISCSDYFRHLSARIKIR